jgi:uncharacterized protein YjbI with pentapeptide repeats
MANPKHLERIVAGVEAWNSWILQHPQLRPELGGIVLAGAKLRKAKLGRAILYQANFREADLSQADLSQADLVKAQLSGANLTKADLSGADLSGADLSGANLAGAMLVGARMYSTNLGGTDLSSAYLERASLIEANLTDATLDQANMFRVDLYRANLTGASLKRANLTRAYLVETNLENADISDCSVYGASAWGLAINDRTRQDGLVISRPDEPLITVDNLEVAQFLYLLLHNRKLRDVIDTVTSKVVLILGRFSLERKVVLDALRDELRKQDFVPAMFDFEKPSNRDMTETILILASMARFVVADISDPRSVPQELYGIVPHLRSVPVQLLLATETGGHAMVGDLLAYPWVLGIYRYENVQSLVASLPENVIAPAEAKATELAQRRKALEQQLFGLSNVTQSANSANTFAR